MPIKQKWLIPDDYDEETTQWSLVTMCIPNTRGWRGVVSGAIYNLTRGRFWDEKTGMITEAQGLGLRIYESMAIDCNNDLTRLADALEAIEAKTPELYTIQEMLDELDDSVLSDIADLTAIMGWLQNLFPNLPQIKFSAADVVSLWFNGRRHRELMAEWWAHNLSLKTIAAATGGGVVEEIADDIFDDILDAVGGLITTAGSIGDLMTGLYGMSQLFQGDNPTYPFSSPDNAAQLRALRNSTVNLEQTLQTNLDLDICCYNTADVPAIEPDAGEQESSNQPPDGWEGTWEEYQTYKCKASNLIVDGYIQYLNEAVRFLTVGELTNVSFAAFLSIVPEIFGSLTLLGLLPSLFSYLVTVIAGLYAMAEFLDDYIDNLEGDIGAGVCALYSAIDADEARANIEDWITDNLPVSSPGGFVTYHIAVLFTNSVLNVLFELYAPASEYTGSVACSGCDLPIVELVLGTGVQYPEFGVEYEYDADYYGGYYYVQFKHSEYPGAGCVPFEAEGTEYTGSGVVVYEVDCSGSITTSAGPPVATYEGGNIYWTSLTDFTVKVIISEA